MKKILTATQITLDLVALGSLGIWFNEPFGWAWRAVSLMVLGAIWWMVFKLCPASLATPPARHRRQESGAARPATAAPVPPSVAVRKPPKSARYTWTLTEDGVPVTVEYDKRAVDNWLALGEQYEAIPHKLN